jgi:flagellar export protein FliJ
MAKPFKLQTVLHHRQRLEDIAAQRLAEGQAREKALRHQIAGQRSAFNLLLEEFAGRQQAGISVHDLQVYRLGIQRSQSRLKTLENEARQLADEVEARRQHLAEACRKKKLLEKLKENHHVEQAHLDNLRDTAQLDEIALRLGMTDL